MKTILILASNPRGDLRIDREIRDLTAAIERSKNSDEFTVVIRLAVRPGDLHEIFDRNSPHIVHFSGHGEADAGLILESDESGEQIITNKALAGLFNLFGKETECVLLNACTTEIQADAIIQHVPYAIGTSREILDLAAYLFSVGFYTALGSGQPIDICHARGINAIELELPNVEIKTKVDDISRKGTVIEVLDSQRQTDPLNIVLKRNSSLINRDDVTDLPPASPEFAEAIRQERIRKDYKNKLRDVLDNFGQIIIRRDKAISKFEYEQRQTFLNKIQEFWIEGFLKPSLYFNTAVDKMEDDPVEQILRPIDNLEVIPFDIDKSYDELNQTDIVGQISGGKTLLILGNPGSGKTIALLQLAERLIKQTQQDMTKSIPVVLNLSSWAEKQQRLQEWLIEELKDKYQVPKAWSGPWIKKQQLTLLLDGLDEVKAEHRNACVRAINKFIADDRPETEIVVCSRVEDYEAITERLLLSSAICIQPLSRKQLLDFLENADDSLLGLKTVIKQDREIAEFAQTPLILNMMTWTYQGWAAEQCQLQFRIAADRQFNLFESYIEKNLNRENREAKYPKEKVLHWLSWLANIMVNESKIIFLIEKMQPTLLQSPTEKINYRIKNFFFVLLLIGMFVGLCIGLFSGFLIGLYAGISWLSVGFGYKLNYKIIFKFMEGLDIGLSYGLRYGTLFGLILGLVGGVIILLSKEITLYEQINWSWQKFQAKVVREIILGIVLGMSISLLTGLFFRTGLSFELGLKFGLFFGLLFVLNSGLSSIEMKRKTLPNQGIWSSSKNSFKFGLLNGLSLGLFFELSLGLLNGLFFLMFGGVIGGLINGGNTCIQHFNLRQILHRKGRIPWNYARFLDYATEHRLMKKVGGGYVFYHRMLMEHFANIELKQ